MRPPPTPLEQVVDAALDGIDIGPDGGVTRKAMEAWLQREAAKVLPGFDVDPGNVARSWLWTILTQRAAARWVHGQQEKIKHD